MEAIEEQYHEMGATVRLSKRVAVVVTKRDDVIQCDDCYFKKRTDCGVILCNYDQRADKENVIFTLKK